MGLSQEILAQVLKNFVIKKAGFHMNLFNNYKRSIKRALYIKGTLASLTPPIREQEGWLPLAPPSTASPR